MHCALPEIDLLIPIAIAIELARSNRVVDALLVLPKLTAGRGRIDEANFYCLFVCRVHKPQLRHADATPLGCLPTVALALLQCENIE